MTVLTCEQGSAKWLKARCGIPTASNMRHIVTPKGKATASAARATYMHNLLYERLYGGAVECHVNAAMERGNALEPRARDWFSMQTGLDVEQVGFVLHDSGKFGVSPDGLIGDNAGIEIKTASPANHIAKLLAHEVPAANVIQIQACLWVCDRELWHYLLYTEDPGVPNMLIEVKRDPVIIDALALIVPVFCLELDNAERKIRKLYDLEPRQAVDFNATPGDWRPF